MYEKVFLSLFFKGSSSVQPFSGNTKQVYVGPEATVSNWYEWSSRPISCTGVPSHVASSRQVSCTGIPGHVTNRLPSAETFSRQTMSVNCQTIPNQNIANCDSNVDRMNYVTYSNDSLKRNHVYGEAPLTKRKLQHDVSMFQNKQLEDFCSYNTGTSLL